MAFDFALNLDFAKIIDYAKECNYYSSSMGYTLNSSIVTSNNKHIFKFRSYGGGYQLLANQLIQQRVGVGIRNAHCYQGYPAKLQSQSFFDTIFNFQSCQLTMQGISVQIKAVYFLKVHEFHKHGLIQKFSKIHNRNTAYGRD